MKPRPPVTSSRMLFAPNRDITGRRSAGGRVLRRHHRGVPWLGCDRPGNAQLAVEWVDGDPGHARLPLRAEAVQVLAPGLGHRLEAVADSGRHEHLHARRQPLCNDQTEGRRAAPRVDAERLAARNADQLAGRLAVQPAERAALRPGEVDLPPAVGTDTGCPVAARSENSRTVPRSSVTTFGVIRSSPSIAVGSTAIGMMSGRTTVLVTMPLLPREHAARSKEIDGRTAQVPGVARLAHLVAEREHLFGCDESAAHRHLLQARDRDALPVLQDLHELRRLDQRVLRAGVPATRCHDQVEQPSTMN